MRRFATFVLIGAGCTLLQYLLLALGVEIFHVHPALSSSIGFMASAAVNYVLNYHVTFRSDSSHLSASGKFAFVAVVGLLVNYALVALLVDAGRWQYMYAQVVATAVVLLWNYNANARWSFASGRSES